MKTSQKTLPQILPLLQSMFQQALSAAFPEIPEKITIKSLAFNNKFKAQYQSPTGLQLFYQYKKSGSLGCASPSEVSQKIIQNLPNSSTEFISDSIVTTQGFINITLCPSFLESTINLILANGIHFTATKLHKFAVDFSSPNIAKDLHVGNLRSTIMGESISRILQECGHEVLKINHLGDWGTQFGMLIERLREVYPDYLKNKPNLVDLQAFYRESKTRFDSDPAFKKRAQLNVTKLQKYEEDEMLAWEMFCELSRQGLNQIYKRLDVTAIECGESYYNKMIPLILEELKQKGLVVTDKGAQCMFVKEGSIPLMVVKSDGGYNYDTTDVAAIRYRLVELHCDRLLYLTDVGQEPHFRLIFAAAEKAGWLNPKEQIAEHMGFGLVLGADGQKMKTKEGNPIPLKQLLTEAKQEALDGLLSRVKDKNKRQISNLKEDEFDDAAEKIGVGAVKYYDLRQNRIQNYKFDKKMISFKGNTAVYLFYSYARICSILKKANIPEEEFQELIKSGFKITHEAEKELVNIIMKFQDIVEAITYTQKIHKLTDFLYALAVKLSGSYQKYKIIGGENTKTRVLLCHVIKLVMEKAMYMLSIKPLDKL